MNTGIWILLYSLAIIGLTINILVDTPLGSALVTDDMCKSILKGIGYLLAAVPALLSLHISEAKAKRLEAEKKLLEGIDEAVRILSAAIPIHFRGFDTSQIRANIMIPAGNNELVILCGLDSMKVQGDYDIRIPFGCGWNTSRNRPRQHGPWSATSSLRATSASSMAHSVRTTPFPISPGYARGS